MNFNTRIVTVAFWAIILCLSLATSSGAQDLLSGGTNSWLLHTPDDGRTTMNVASGYNSGNWLWSKQFIFYREGHFRVYDGDFLMAANRKLYSYGRMHIHGEERLYLLNRGGVIVSKGWGGNGNLKVEGGITMLSSQTLYNNGRQYIHGEENLYLLNKGGVFVSKAWGGNGNLRVEGGLTMLNNQSLYNNGRQHIHGEELLYLMNKAGVRVSKAWGGNGKLVVEGQLTMLSGQTLYNNGRQHIHGEERLYLLNKGGVYISSGWGGTGNLNVSNNGYFGGTVTTGSSRELKNNIAQLSGDEAMEALMSLMPVKYNYKTNSDELELGFIAEDVPDLVARNDRKSLSPMDFATLSVTVIQQQQEQIEELRAMVEELINSK